MKITLYVSPINFTEYLLGNQIMFFASLQQWEGYIIPIVVKKRDYNFELQGPSVLRVTRCQNQSIGPM